MSNKAIVIKKKDLWRYSTFVLVIALAVALFFMFYNPTESTSIDNAKSVIENNDPLLGNAEAEISVIEFSDFQCVFCAKAFTTTVADFKASSYFTEGKVNLIYKQLPLDTACNTNMRQQLHPNACKSAEASLCADDQEKFWEYHDILFANQNALETDNLKDYAKQLELNENQFNTCLELGKYKAEVKKEISQAASVGGQGTPYFVVVNTKTGKATTVSGAHPFASGTAQITLEDAIKAVQ